MNDSEFKNVVRKGFDQASVGYDNSPMRFFDKSAVRLVELSALKGNEIILDVATGTGKAALAAAEQLKNGKVIGIDLSEGMLSCAKVKAQDAGLTNILFKCEDADHANFPDNYFDGILCSFGMFFFSDMQYLLKKLMQTMKPGGLLAITSFADGSFHPLSDLTLNRFKQYGVKLPDSYTWQKLDSHQKHLELLNSVGLKDINSRTEQMGYYLKSADEWWDIVYYTGFRGFLNQLSKEQVERYKEEHLKEISRTADQQGILLNVDVIFTLANK